MSGGDSSVNRLLEEKSKAARKKGFKTYVDSKALTLNPWKRTYYSIIGKSLCLKV